VNGILHGQIPLVVAENGRVLKYVSDSQRFASKNPPAVAHATHTHPTTQQMAYPSVTSQPAFFSQPVRQAHRQAHQHAHQHPSHLLETVEENPDHLLNSALYQMDQDNMSSSPFDDAREGSHGQYSQYAPSGSVNPANGAFTGTGSTQWVPTGGVPMTSMRRSPFHPSVGPFRLSYISILTHYTKDLHSSHGKHIPPVLFLTADVSWSDL
jgi:hypothetical protein